MLGYTIAILLVMLNIWMTRRVAQAPDEHLSHKRLLITSIWLMPFLGALTARNHLRLHVPGEAYRRRAKRWAEHVVSQAAPAWLSIPGAPDWSIVDHLEIHRTLPMLDWGALEGWRAAILEAEMREQALDAGRRAWLLHVRDALGSEFTLHETEGAWVLSSLEPALLTATADLIVETRKRIARLLGRLSDAPRERTILLVFDAAERYFQYTGTSVAEVNLESETVAGAFVAEGCPHFVTTQAQLMTLEPLIVHQLTRDMLSHLRLPTWLHEGIAVNAEHRITGAPLHSQIPLSTHQDFWDEDQIQAFWSGELFRRPDDASALSYDLAELIVEHLSSDWRAFEDFVLNASLADAGAAAARDHLGIDQGACVCALIGLEPSMAWSPRAFSFV